MALADKLKEQTESESVPVTKQESNQELKALMEQTTELNKLMQSYIRVHLNEDTMKKLTVESELESVKRPVERFRRT